MPEPAPRTVPGAPARCRLCGSAFVSFLRVLEASDRSGPRWFFRCADCGSVMDAEAAPRAYAEDDHGSVDPALALKVYVEVGAGLPFMARQLVLLQRALARPAVRCVEAGAGVGFAVDMARLLGWDATGLEPSGFADAGRRLLDVPLERIDLASARLPDGLDAAVAFEVLEHVADPDAFVATLTATLQPRGILLLTTPNAAILADETRRDRSEYEAFSPGFHLNLLSGDALRLLLARHGFADTRLFTCEGSTGALRLVAVACRQTGVIPPDLDPRALDADGMRLLEWYLRRTLSTRPRDGNTGMVEAGALHRLVELLVHQGRFAEADPHVAAMDALLDDAGFALDDAVRVEPEELPELLTRVPAGVGAYLFHRGLHTLAHRDDAARAARDFRASAHLGRLEEADERLFPGAGRSARATLHEGIALLRAGEREAAIAVFDAVRPRGDLLEPAERDALRWHDAVARLQLRQNATAVHRLTDLALRRSNAAPESREAIAHAVLAASQLLEDGLGENAANVDAAIRAMDAARQGTREDDAARTRSLEEAFARLEARVGASLEAVEARLEERLSASLASRLAALAGTMDRVRTDMHALREGLDRVAARRSLPERVVRRLLARGRGRSDAGAGEVPLGELVRGRHIAQRVTCPPTGLASIGVKLGTYCRTNTSQLELTVAGEDGQVLRRVVEPAEDFVDNALHRFAFDPLAPGDDSTYTVRFSSPDAEPGNAVTIWSRPDAPGGGLAVDGRPQPGALVFELGAPRTLRDAAARDLLIVTPDTVGAERIGLGMRHWEMATALAARGLSVTLALPHEPPPGLTAPAFDLVAMPASGGDLPDLLARHRAVLVQGDILIRHPGIASHGTPIIADMVTPIHIENLDVGQTQFDHALHVVRETLRQADFFICGNERQRLYWLGMLTSLGRLSPSDRTADRELRALIDVVGFGIPDEEPIAGRHGLRGTVDGIGADDFVLIWFGGIWNWLDPTALVEAVHGAHALDPRVKLFFSFYRRTGQEPTARARQTRALAERLGALDRSVFFGDLPIPHAERADYLLDASMGVLCQAPNFETQVSARTRVLDYFWAGLPVLMNDGDEMAELVEREQLGVIARGPSRQALQDAMLRMAGDRAALQAMAGNVRRVRDRFRWGRVVDPIVRHLRPAGTPPADMPDAAAEGTHGR